MSIRVSADGTADYSAISDAVQAAADNEVINVAPGTYSESIIIKKPLTLAGDGPRDQIIIQSNSSACIDIDDPHHGIETGSVVIKGLTLSNEKHKSEDVGDFTVSVDDAEVLINECDIAGSSLASVGVYGSSANVTIKNCIIHHNEEQSGIYFYDQSAGRVEDCKIHNNSKNGISIKKSDVIVQNSTIEHNNSGIYIDENAEVTVTNCKVIKNSFEAVTLIENSKCSISESDLTYNGGKGAFDIDDSSSLTQKSNKLELTEKEMLDRIKDPEADIFIDIEPYLKHDSEKIKLQAKLTLVGRDDCYYRLLSDFADDENHKVRLGTAKHSMCDLVILNQLKNDKDPAVIKYVSSVLSQRKKAENLAGAIVKWLKRCQDNQQEGFVEEEDICEAYITIYDAGKKDTPGKYCAELSFGNSVEFDSLVLDLKQFLYKNLKSNKKYHLVVQYRYLYDKKDIEFGEFIVDFKNGKVKQLGTWNISDPKCNPVLINKVLQAPVPEGPISEEWIYSPIILIKALQNPAVSGKSITEFWNWNYELSNHWENFSEEDKETQKKMIHAVTNNPALKSFIDQLVFIQDNAIRDHFMEDNILVNQYADEWNDWSQKRFDLVKNIETPQTLYANLFRDKGLINKVLEEFDQLDELLQQKIISCIRELDFKIEGHWRVFKSFYKVSENIRVKEILSELLIRLELMERSWGNWKNGFHSKNENLPGWRTVLYMKRRGRRFMKKLADESPVLYLELAYTLITHSQDCGPWKWTTYDTLLGRSPRFLHTRHGRGKVKQIIQDGFPHRFEERSNNKDLWNGKAEELKELLEQKEDLPWQTEEFAVKILHRTHSDYPFQHSDPKTIQPDRIKGWFANPSVWLKYLAGKGAERLFKEPIIIAEKRAGDSHLIDSGLSDIFANMLFYAADDIRTALYGSAIKSYPVPAFDHHLFDLDNNPVISSLVQHFNSISSLDLAEPQEIHAKTGILLQVCKEMVNDAKNDSLANSLWFVKDARHYKQIRGGAEKKAEEVQYLIYNEDGTIESVAENDESEAEIAAPGKKVMDYLNTARDPKCTSKKLINITDDVDIPWAKPEAGDLLAAIGSNPNTPEDRLKTIVETFGDNPKVCIGIAANPKRPSGLKGKLEAVRVTRSTTLATAECYLLMKFYYEYLCTTLSLLKTTLPAAALTQRSLIIVKLINADIFPGYFVNNDIRSLVLDIAEILFHHQIEELNELCYTALQNYPAIQYDDEILNVAQRWLETAINGTGEQKQTVSDQMNRIIANVKLPSYRKYDNVYPFINHESFYISDFIWLSSSMYSETYVPHELWLYVLKEPEYRSDWSNNSMEEINSVTKLSNALQSKSAVQLLTGILEDELKILENTEPDKDALHIYPVLNPKLMIYLVNKKISGISDLIFEMIEQKALGDDPAEWLPLINELTGRQKTKLKSVMINCLRTSGNISLEWLSHIALFNKTEQKRIKNIIIENLNGKKSITLDWFIPEKYLALFNGEQQTNIENIIVNSYCDFTFKEEYYKSETHPLRHYMIYPLGFKGDDDIDAFGPRVFEISWKIAEVGILKDDYLGAFIDDLLAVPQNRARAIVKQIHSLHNEGSQDSILAQLEKRLLQDKSKIVVCSSSVSKLMIDNLPYEKTLDYLTVDNPAIWSKLKPHMLRKISRPGGGMFFWQHVFNYLSGHERSMELHKVKNSSGRMILEGGDAWKREVADGNIVPGSIYTRTLKDPDFLDEFYSQKNPETLSIHNQLFADEVFTWVQKHEKLFKANSDYLLTISTHKLPNVRQWGLKKVKTLGMRLPFALQLIESSLPEPYKTAQDWFRAGTGRNEFIKILALCDSPLTKVQHFGLKLMNERKATLLNAQKMEMIAENSDPKILEFVAGHVLEGEEHQQFMRLFDRTILKHKEKYRKVKETIKQRVEKDLSIDPETLIEMVRGHQKRDAEWALVQLTKMSLKGQAIDGFEVQQMK